MSRRTHHEHDTAPLSLYNRQSRFAGGQAGQSRFAYFLTRKTVVRKFGTSDGQTGSRCLDKAVLAQEGGGVPAVQRAVVFLFFPNMLTSCTCPCVFVLVSDSTN